MYLFCSQALNLCIKKIIHPIITIISPITVNHLDPCFFISSVKRLPNLYERKDTIKKRKPLEIKLIKMKIKILKPIKPLAMVKTLQGKGVKPAKKRIPSQA